MHNILCERAANQSADFVEKHLEKSLIFYSKKDIWDFVVISLKENFDNGIFIEFGVASEQPLIKII